MERTLIKPTVPIAKADEIKELIFEEFGKTIQALEIHRNQILVAKYIRKKTGSLITAPATQKEDGYQGKVGLVLKLGHLAYVDDDIVQFHGERVNVGDWVFYRMSDGIDLALVPSGSFNQLECRLFDQEKHIRGRIPHPDLIY